MSINALEHKKEGLIVYEARRPARLNYVLAILCALLSLIGFFVAGIIPSTSTANHGAQPLAGIGIIIACLAPAFIFLRRAKDRSVILRADENGLYARPYSDATIPWDAIEGVKILRFKNQSVLRVKLHDKAAWPGRPGLSRTIGALDNAVSYGDFGINPSYYDNGMAKLVAAVHYYRPDFAG